MRLRKGLAAVLMVCALAARADVTPDYNIGVYYFPGWKNKAPGALIDYPWIPIKNYPERKPLLGWYPEGDVGVMDQQLAWMNSYGVDFVVFDWYWNAAKKPYLDHAINAYLQAPKRKLVQFALLWANDAQAKVPSDEDQFLSMIQFWIAHYFGNAQYMKIDNKPVVFVFSPELLRNDAAGFGASVGQLFARANQLAQRAGYAGVYFVASTEAVENWVKWFDPDNGFAALSAYNYHRGFSGVYNPLKLMSWSYRELDDDYRESWDWILKASKLPYFVPVTTGWDKSPWGGSLDRRHDQSGATPAQFRGHLQAARARLDRYPEKTRKTALICCWNEYGEGSVLEPTQHFQFQFLEAVRAVFGVNRPNAPGNLRSVVSE
jgi:hypothetical protein